MKTKKPRARERGHYSLVHKVGIVCLLAIYGLMWYRAISMIRAGDYVSYRTFYGFPMGAGQLVTALLMMGLIGAYGIVDGWRKRNNSK